MVKHIDSTIRIVDKKPMKHYVMSRPSIEVLLEDPSLEEIMINKANAPVIVYHKEFGMCETNLKLDAKTLMKYISDFAKQRGEKLNSQHPFLDSRLHDGSRINITIPPITPDGPVITIRKFNRNPLSIIDLIKKGTMTTEMAAFLWTAVEGRKDYPFNILIVGGAGSGKTSTLTALVSFIPQQERIISIEDPLEIYFGKRKNIVRMEYHPNPKGKAMTMNMLLENALRMRPDRLLLGEIRGEEAKTLFNAMNVGHSAMGTMHANSPRDCIARLMGEPMSVPENMLHLVDLIIVQQNIRDRDRIKRRITEIVEVQKSGNSVSFNTLFAYNPKKDSCKRSSTPSAKIEILAKLSGVEISAINKEIEEKRKILEKLLKNDVYDFDKVSLVIEQYYENSDIILGEL
ncbi:CpaF family protein [Candidatus Micrarchaeota archaeon]|nr:MAG: CpaF family protein [Candidatus Micrarchaeota archaeon]